MSLPVQTASKSDLHSTSSSSSPQEQSSDDPAESSSHDVEKQHSSTTKATATAADSLKEERNPLNFPTWKKNVILGVICSCCLCITCASSVISTDYTALERDLGASEEVAILSLSLFVLGLALGPPFVAPFSERYGRWPVYVISFGAFFLLSFPVAFANNLPVLFIFRFLTGIAGSGFLNVAGGSISDMWVPSKTFMPLAYFTFSTFNGPVVGPVYGSFVAQFTTQWRWSLWTITIWSFINLVCILAFTPETYAPALLRKQAKQQGREKTTEEDDHPPLLVSIASDLKKIPLLLYHEPMLTLLCVWTGILLGIIYLFFEFFPTVFSSKGLSEYQVGLCFLGIMVSNSVALATMPFWRKHYLAQRDPVTGNAPPEARLGPAKLGCFLTPIGLFIFAFTSYSNVPWIGAVIGSALFGMGCYYLFFSIFIYTTINWRPVAASAMGANSMVRCSLATIFPLFANQMLRRLTPAGASALLAGLNCLMIPVPFVLTRYGAQIRARSRFTS